jgi:hypothetical protein
MFLVPIKITHYIFNYNTSKLQNQIQFHQMTSKSVVIIKMWTTKHFFFFSFFSDLLSYLSIYKDQSTNKIQFRT